MSLDDLYQDLILDHYRRPRNRGTLASPDRSFNLQNPLCGDEVGVAVALDPGGRIADIKFTGQGCSISLASASMMTEGMKGKTVAEALALARTFRTLMRGEAGAGAFEAARDALGDAIALEGVLRFPVRVRCATLAWTALERALAGHGPGA